ncbi:hypothetical protein [Roseibium sp.]|uniref:hypothetical protein n=1 Tax=Roseibium sp. TaxID=1936156 RepID=UPI00326587C8
MANITVIVSLSIAVMSYLQQIQQTKRDTAVSVVTAFNSGDMLAIQRRLSIEFAKLKLGQLQGVAVKRDTIEAIVENMVATSADAAETQQDVITLVSNLDDIAVCVEAETCDRNVVEASLGETASRYACLLLPYAAGLRQELLLEGLGDSLRAFIDYEATC